MCRVFALFLHRAGLPHKEEARRKNVDIRVLRRGAEEVKRAVLSLQRMPGAGA